MPDSERFDCRDCQAMQKCQRFRLQRGYRRGNGFTWITNTGRVTIPIPLRCAEQCGDRCKSDYKRTLSMLSPALHDSPAAKRRHEGKHSLPYYGNPVRALISPPRDHQDLSGFHHLPHAQPGLCASPGIGSRRKRISKIESAVLPECRFIERMPQPLERRAALSHYSVRPE